MALARRLPDAQVELASALLARGAPAGEVAHEVPDPRQRERFLRLVEAWGSAGGSLPELGAALAAASRASAAERRAVSPEPVWTGPLPLFPQVRRTDQVLVELITTARQDLLIVSLVTYRVPAVRTALVEALSRGVRLTCVLEDSAVNPDVVDQDPARLLGPEPSERVTRLAWPLARREEYGDGLVGKLHAKCAVADDDQLLIGSANLTQAALEHNIELGVAIRGGPLPRQVKEHFERLRRAGVLAPA